ncbi:hypothetical protein [Mycobacteroides abscessus]|uniref:hypothetical protein n=1 Tax=Mycobacteroides abscessus TaxID=36809 RepID=UPI000E693699|nr:hypothetical protein [Mycobacteroides abscessus]RIT55681.1 hypothetical protein D2E90_24465 [Mycobacteroides abscessus]
MSFRRWSVSVSVSVLLLAVGCSFFGAPRSGDWRAKTDDDAAILSVADAVRAIDPCGLVDAESIKATIPRAISFGYTDGFDRCTLALGAYDGDFPSDVSATIGFDLAPEAGEPVEQPTDSVSVNGIAITHMLGPTSNRGWCRYVFNLGLDERPVQPAGRVRVNVVASLARDPGPGRPVYPCREASAIASGAAQMRSQHLPRREGSAPGPAGQDPCSLLPHLDGFSSYRRSNPGAGLDPYACRFGAGPAADGKAPDVEPDVKEVEVALRPVGPHEPDTSRYGQDRRTVVEDRDGVELHVSTVTSTYDKPFCEVFVYLGKEYQPMYFPPERARPGDSRRPGAVVRGTSSCDDVKGVAVAAGRKFGQS